MIPPEQFKPNWTAIGVIGGFVINISGWFIVHFLTKRREAQKEKRAKDDADAKEQKRIEAALRLTDSARDILRKCVAADGFERGRVWILAVGGRGSWVRAGKHDFFDESNPANQARYLDAFETMLNRGYFRHEGGMVYQLTGIGFERAENDT